MTNFAVQDASGTSKEFATASGVGSGGSPFQASTQLVGSNESAVVGSVNLTSTGTTGAVRQLSNTLPSFAVLMGGDDGTNIEPLQLDASNFLKVVLQAGTAAMGKLSANSGVDIGDVDVTSLPRGTSIGHGKKVVPTAGSAVALAGDTVIVHSVTIKALAGNTNNVYVGSDAVDSTNGYVLDAGETHTIEISNLNLVYLDVDTNGEGVTYIAS
jgi:hypothetical protein